MDIMSKTYCSAQVSRVTLLSWRICCFVRGKMPPRVQGSAKTSWIQKTGRRTRCLPNSSLREYSFLCTGKYPKRRQPYHKHVGDEQLKGIPKKWRRKLESWQEWWGLICLPLPSSLQSTTKIVIFPIAWKMVFDQVPFVVELHPSTRKFV